MQRVYSPRFLRADNQRGAAAELTICAREVFRKHKNKPVSPAQLFDK